MLPTTTLGTAPHAGAGAGHAGMLPWGGLLLATGEKIWSARVSVRRRHSALLRFLDRRDRRGKHLVDALAVEVDHFQSPVFPDQDVAGLRQPSGKPHHQSAQG